jgi:hypothetical protein
VEGSEPVATAFLLQRGPDRPADLRDPERRERPDDESGRVLACARCLHTVTTTGARIEISGHHAHTFANPHGFVFHIGCFALAPGCAAVGEPTTEFTWFPGFAWQIATCRGCREHLGWLFRSAEGRFHGLIMDRLVEDEGPSDVH